MGTGMDGIPRYRAGKARQGKLQTTSLPVAAREVTHLTSRLVAEKNGAARPSATEWVPAQDKPCLQPNRATCGNHAHQGCPFLSRVLVLRCEVPVCPNTVRAAYRKYPLPIGTARVHEFRAAARRVPE